MAKIETTAEGANWVWRALALALHALPLWPFSQGYLYGGLAAVLLAALPYIKSAKLNSYLVALENRHPEGARHEAVQKEIASLRRSRASWRRLTLLPPESEPS